MENNKKLIVYYSYTGHTKMIANKIKEKLNCDMLELKPQVPYSTTYQDVVDEEELNASDNRTREIIEIDKNLDNYDEIIILTPVWWYSITPVIRTFLKEFDLSNKTIYPCATNAGWLGHTFEEIKKLCPNSKVENGMNIVFESYSDNLKTKEEEINQWLESL